jgi:hypothetical protein
MALFVWGDVAAKLSANGQWLGGNGDRPQSRVKVRLGSGGEHVLRPQGCLWQHINYVQWTRHFVRLGLATAWMLSLCSCILCSCGTI